jgi:hypothetical protein
MGTYQADPDGYAIVETIVLNEERLRTLEPFMKLVLLLKLLLCAGHHQRGGDGTFGCGLPRMTAGPVGS